MGKLQAIPGSHLRGLLEFMENQEADYPFDIDREAVGRRRLYRPGRKTGRSFSFFLFLVHRSGNNLTEDIRLTTNFRFNNRMRELLYKETF